MDQVQKFINQLASLVGVQGAFIFDQQGTIQQFSTPMKVSLDQGVALASTLSRTLTGLSTVHGSTKMDIDLAYDEGRLVVKGFDQGGLCIICERHLNYSLLNITLEQGSGLIRGADPQSSVVQTARIVEVLKEIATEILGEHALKVTSILESAGSDQSKLEEAITQAENITRMFIDKDQARKMAEQMREVMKSN